VAAIRAVLSCDKGKQAVERQREMEIYELRKPCRRGRNGLEGRGVGAGRAGAARWREDGAAICSTKRGGAGLLDELVTARAPQPGHGSGKGFVVTGRSGCRGPRSTFGTNRGAGRRPPWAGPRSIIKSRRRRANDSG